MWPSARTIYVPDNYTKIQWAVDNATAGRSFTVSADTTPPDTTITSGPSGTINYSDVKFIWTGTDDNTPTSELAYSYKLDGYDSDWSPWTSATSKEYKDLPNGEYTFRVKAKDEAGNVDPTPAEQSFKVTANPAVLFVIPNEVKVTFTVGREMYEPKTEFQIGESVGLSLNGEWLRGGDHPAIAQDVTFVISDKAGDIIWNKSVGPVGEGWSSGPGGGWGVGVSWAQIDNEGKPVPAGIYTAGVIFKQPAFDFPEDFSKVISFEIINGTSVFIHSYQDFGSGSLTVAIGDIDGDHDLDIILGNGGNKVYRNNDGTFSYDYSFGIYSHHSKCIRLGDLDGDGDLDFIEGSLNAGPHLQEKRDFRLYENDGTGNFTFVKQLISGSPIYVDGSQFMEVADIDGDNDLDILVCLVSSLEIYLNKGNWNFIKSQTIPTSYSKDIAIGDIDNDGDLDIVIANSENSPNKVLRNDGTGNFIDTGQSLGSSYTYSVTLGDIDKDGDLDLIAGNIAAQNKVYLNNGNGVFTFSYAFGATRGYSHPVVLGDIDNDGDMDMITGGDRTCVYLNDGTGHFIESEHSLIGTGGLTGDVALADIDNDGDLDLITAGQQNKLYISTSNPNQQPIANFTYYPEKPVVNQSVTFDASSSYDPDGNITKYEWDFGDGETASGKIVTHAYSDAGSYTVTLTVTDDDAATHSISKKVNVTTQWSFAIITDLHIGYGLPDYGREGFKSGEGGQEYYLTERLRRIVNWINKHKDEYNLRFVAVLGDISDTAE
ncbi:hypothetical protein DRJ19_05910, partial [Candidatus Woesearchaeota archaeon]